MAPGASADLRVDLRTSGGMTASWHGEPARGCAEAGVCDVAGSVTLTPQAGDSSITTSGTRLLDTLSLTVQRPTVRALRGPPEHPAGACLDAAGPVELSLGTGRPTRGRIK